MKTMRVHSVDVLRGLCALSVMAYHFAHWTGLDASPLVGPLLRKVGIYGVEAFFVISGFSLFVANERRDLTSWGELRDFFIRRAFRILPLLYVATLATLAFTPTSLVTLIGNAAVLPIVLRPETAVATGAWSLGVEWAFYFAFPLMIRLRLRYAAVASLTLLAGFAGAMDPDASLASQNALYVNPLNHAAFFVAGMALAKYRHRLPALSALQALGGSAVVLIAFTLLDASAADQVAVVVGWSRFAFLSLSVVLVGLFARWQLSGARPLTWFGDISFALYLVHPLAFIATARLDGPAHGVAAISLTFAIATLSYYAFEKPVLTLSKRLTRRRSAVAV